MRPVHVWLMVLGGAALSTAGFYATCRGAPLWLAVTGVGVCAAGVTCSHSWGRGRPRLTWLVLVTACVGLVIWLRSSPFYVIETFGWGDAPFDQAAWQGAEAPRAPMVRDLLRTNRLEGRSAEEVRGLLGPPNDVWVTDGGATKRWSYTFDVSLFLDNNTLAMYLGKDDRVTSVFVSSD